MGSVSYRSYDPTGVGRADSAAVLTHYVADFIAGSARSKRTTTPFAFAWRVTYDIDGELAMTGGFCTTRALAEDAAARQVKSIGPARKSSRALLQRVEITEARAASADGAQVPASVVRSLR